jgi:hypothetical protein
MEVESRHRVCRFGVSIDAACGQSLQYGSQVRTWGKCAEAAPDYVHAGMQDVQNWTNHCRMTAGSGNINPAALLWHRF